MSLDVTLDVTGCPWQCFLVMYLASPKAVWWKGSEKKSHPFRNLLSIFTSHDNMLDLFQPHVLCFSSKHVEVFAKLAWGQQQKQQQQQQQQQQPVAPGGVEPRNLGLWLAECWWC